MALKVYKPITAGTRTRIDLRRDELTTDRPEKSLTSGLKSHGGRDAQGRISVRHQGGGHKRKYRDIDFKRTSTAFLEQFEQSNMIQTAVQILLLFFMPTVKNVILLHLRD